MPSLTIKNLSDDLYEHLKQAATAHRRSINSELIVCLEKTLLPKKISAEERLSVARALRHKTNATKSDAASIDAAKNEGRR